MLQWTAVLRGALNASQRFFIQVFDAPTSSLIQAASTDRSSKLSTSSQDARERVEALERLSNEVFGRGNKHLKNVETLTALPEGLHSFPEVCFIGKPNCGKSSLISCLLHNRQLGKAGATPGTTRLLQFFNVGDALLLVDTPGYGGWRGREVTQRLTERANAFSILFRYLALRNGSNLKRVYWLMESSARSPVSFQCRDEELRIFLSRERIPFSIVLTKIDRHWRRYAEEQRTVDAVGKTGVISRRRAPPNRGRGAKLVSPEDGVAQNMREVFDFLGTDAVPIIGVSTNRQQPWRSRHVEMLQHDIVHHCTQDLTPGEDLTYKNMHALSYAPPTAERIYEVQLQYPVESFVVPENNNLSLARMVEQHETMKASFLKRSVTAQMLSASDLSLCLLPNVEAPVNYLEDSAHQTQVAEASHLRPVIFPRNIGDTEAAPLPCLPRGGQEALDEGPFSAPEDGVLSSRNTLSKARSSEPSSECRFHAQSVLTAERDRESDPRVGSTYSENEMREVIASRCSKMDGDATSVAVKAKDSEGTMAAAPASASPSFNYLVSRAGGTVQGSHTRIVALASRTASKVELPAILEANARYVYAIDGTRIPRSLVSVSVEHLAAEKEDEVTSFAFKSGAGAYEELLLHDREANGLESDPFVTASNAACLPEAVHDQLQIERGHRTPSAAQKRKERLLNKYVERKRKDRSIHMQAEGYMCPWVGGSTNRSVVRGLQQSSMTGRSGALLRNLKEKGFGGQSYSARTMKNRGRATKKTGSWAA